MTTQYISPQFTFHWSPKPIKANLAAWVNDILRNELSYLLLFSVDHNHARRHWIANQRRLVQYMTHFHS